MESWQVAMYVFLLVAGYFVYDDWVKKNKLPHGNNKGRNIQEANFYESTEKCHNCKHLNDIEIKKGMSKDDWLNLGAKCSNCGMTIRKMKEAKIEKTEKPLVW